MKRFINILNQHIFGSQSQKHGHYAAFTLYCKHVIIGFSQLFCLPDYDSDLVVRPFILHLVELCSIPSSIHAHNFKNSVY